MTNIEGPQREQRIVVGVDGSEPSRQALLWAVHQATLTGAQVEAVMTWHVPVVTAYGGLGPVPTDAAGPDFAEKALNELISEALGDPWPLGVVARVIEGPPGDVLVTEARRAELLVVGNRGHGTWAGLLLGSVSKYCVGHATCPVVVVRHALAA